MDVHTSPGLSLNWLTTNLDEHLVDYHVCPADNRGKIALFVTANYQGAENVFASLHQQRDIQFFRDGAPARRGEMVHDLPREFDMSGTRFVVYYYTGNVQLFP